MPLVSAVDSPSPKLYLSLLRVWWSLPFPLHFQHINQLPQEFIISPSISPLSQTTWHPDRTCAMVLLFPHSLQFESSLSPHYCKFTEDFSASYTDHTRNEILNWSFLHSSARVNSRSHMFHFIQTPCFPSSIALAFLWSSSVRLTSAWSIVRLSAADILDHCWKCDSPKPCLTSLVFPMISRKWRIISAWSTDVFADHFPPVLVWIPAQAALSFAESLKPLPNGHL